MLIYQQEKKKRGSPKIPVKPLVLGNKQRNGLLGLRGTQMEIAEWRSLQRKAGKVSLAFAHFAGDSHKPRGNSLVVNPSKGASALCLVFFNIYGLPLPDLSWGRGTPGPSLKRAGGFLAACGILVPWPGMNPGPQLGEIRFLAAGPPGNCPALCFLKDIGIPCFASPMYTIHHQQALPGQFHTFPHILF